MLFKLFLSREKIFQFNRFALLLLLSLAALAPLFSIPIEIASTAQPIFFLQSYIPIPQIEISEPTTTSKATSPVNWIFLT
jgi:hypothetical protein